MRFSVGQPTEVSGTNGLMRWPVLHTFIEDFFPTEEVARRHCDMLNINDLPNPPRGKRKKDPKP